MEGRIHTAPSVTIRRSSVVSTIASPPRPTPAPPVPSSPPQIAAVLMGQQRIAIRNVGWHVYDLLSDAIGEGQHIYLAYDGSDLEIMTTGFRHDHFKELLGWFVRIVTSELRIRSRAPGRPHGSDPRARGAWKLTSATSSRPKSSPPSWRRSLASPTISPTIPTPTWRSRSISRLPRLTGPGSMRR